VRSRPRLFLDIHLVHREFTEELSRRTFGKIFEIFGTFHWNKLAISCQKKGANDRYDKKVREIFFCFHFSFYPQFHQTGLNDSLIRSFVSEFVSSLF
jgi:hypothetical protein